MNMKYDSGIVMSHWDREKNVATTKSNHLKKYPPILVS